MTLDDSHLFHIIWGFSLCVILADRQKSSVVRIRRAPCVKSGNNVLWYFFILNAKELNRPYTYFTLPEVNSKSSEKATTYLHNKIYNVDSTLPLLRFRLSLLDEPDLGDADAAGHRDAGLSGLDPLDRRPRCSPDNFLLLGHIVTDLLLLRVRI